MGSSSGAESIREQEGFCFLCTRKNYRQKIPGLQQDVCGYLELASKGLSSLANIIEISMALVFIVVFLLELFTAAKSAKLMRQQPNSITEYK